MSYHFQKWPAKKGDSSAGAKEYIRFSGTKQMHLSTALASTIMSEWCADDPNKPCFDVFVDEERRLIGLCPGRGNKGAFKFEEKTLPPVWGMGPFVNQYQPKLSTRLMVTWVPPEKCGGDFPGGMWVANMDGGLVEIPDDNEPGSCFGNFDITGKQGCAKCALQPECKKTTFMSGVARVYEEREIGCLKQGKQTRQVVGGSVRLQLCQV